MAQENRMNSGNINQQHFHRGRNPQLEEPHEPLTVDELNVLKSCTRDSLVYRCFPLTCFLICGYKSLEYRGLVRRSYFRPALLAVGAYVIGNLSFRGECRRRIMELPNSRLAEKMKEGHTGIELMQVLSTPDSDANETSQQSSSGTEDIPQSRLKWSKNADVYSNNMQMETHRSAAPGLDDSQRPSLDHDSSRNIQQDSAKQPLVTYELLRQQNRQKTQSPHTGEAVPQLKPISPPTPSKPTPPTSRPKYNKYGDLIED